MGELSVNRLLREYRSSWPGGLSEAGYSTLNLIAHCRHGELGFNRAECAGCHQDEWYPSSCGDRHCPKCLGPRQAAWSESVCKRLPDCPHFHVVFTVPSELHAFFETNYRLTSELLFAAAAETLSLFQESHWKMKGAFFGVLHTWGSRLNWHPHLHMLVSAGGQDLSSGGWKQVRPNYLFAVKAMSRVFRGIMLRKVEELEGSQKVQWLESAATVEQRREWRLSLARQSWNIFSRPTLGNTRAVVRYLARYTSRIAISNHRLSEIDTDSQTVSFEWKDYSDHGRTKKETLPVKTFLYRFSRHLVPKGLRRIRYYGLLMGKKQRMSSLSGAPQAPLQEKAVCDAPKICRHCQSQSWIYHALYLTRKACVERFQVEQSTQTQRIESFSLPPPGIT